MATINEALWTLRETYRAEANPERKQQLQDQYDRALSAVLEMADKDIGDNTEAFQKAVEGLDNSIASLQQAKRELGNIAKAITNVAKAVDAVVKVAAKVAAV